MKMAQRGTMLQVFPHFCSPAVQSSIWPRSRALTRTQVEETMERATEIEGEAARMTASSWQPLPGLAAPFTSFHLSMPLLPFLSLCFPLLPPPGLSGAMEGNRAQPPPPGHYQTHTCCLVPPLSFLLCSLACFRSCVLIQPWLMGISHFCFLAVYAYECALRQIIFWNFFLCLQYVVIDMLCFLCILHVFSSIVTLTWHIASLTFISMTLLRWKTKHFAFEWSARWNVLNQLLPSLSTLSQQSRDDSCLTGYHDYLTLKAPLHPSVLQQLPPPHPALTSPSLPLPPFHHFFPCNTNAIHSEKRGEGRGCRLFESSSTSRTELSPQRQERQRQATGAIKNSWPIERH